jgi:hypothetical protein
MVRTFSDRFRQRIPLVSGVPMRYVIAIFAFACALVWDFTQNHGAYTQQVVRNVSHFVRTTL